MYKGKKNSTRLWIKRARVGLEPDCWLRQATTSIDLNQKNRIYISYKSEHHVDTDKFYYVYISKKYELCNDSVRQNVINV